jgi:hypothetical protein
VDGVPVPFRLWRDPEFTVAAALLAERGVVLGIRGVPLRELRLARVDDLGPFLGG